jgi:tripartite ATP-independent transporter DctP family solute receptor
MKKVLCRVLLATAALLPMGQVGATTYLRLAYAENSQPVKDALKYIGAEMEKRSGGEVKVLYFPDGQLGGERELVELAQVGAVDITKVSSGLLESFAPVYGVFSLPYLFPDQDSFYRVMDNPRIMQPIYESTAPQGFTGVAWYDSGARNFYMSKAPVRTIADLKGKKIRVMQSETAIRSMKLLGASPIAMGQAEVYTSIQQGIIDGAENNEFALTMARHGEVAKFYSLDMHTRIPDIIVLSNLTRAQLTPEQFAMLMEVIRESVEVEKKAWASEMAKTRKQAVDEFGVQFIEIDPAPFKQAVQPIYDDLNPALAETYRRMAVQLAPSQQPVASK